MKLETLDKRIANALAASGSTPKATLLALVDEIGEAIAAAEELVELETKRSLDLANDDPDASSDAIAKAQLKITRWTKAVPLLRTRIAQIDNAEYLEKWHARADELEQERNSLANELEQTYSSLAQALANLFARIDDCDARIGQLHASAPAMPFGEGRRVAEVELVARGLDGYRAVNPPLRNNLRLPYFSKSRDIYFPPPPADYGQMAFQSLQPALSSMAAKDALKSGPNWYEAKALEEQERKEAFAKREAELDAEQLRARDEFNRINVEQDRRRRLGLKQGEHE